MDVEAEPAENEAIAVLPHGHKLLGLQLSTAEQAAACRRQRRWGVPQRRPCGQLTTPGSRNAALGWGAGPARPPCSSSGRLAASWQQQRPQRRPQPKRVRACVIMTLHAGRQRALWACTPPPPPALAAAACLRSLTPPPLRSRCGALRRRVQSWSRRWLPTWDLTRSLSGSRPQRRRCAPWTVAVPNTVAVQERASPPPPFPAPWQPALAAAASAAPAVSSPSHRPALINN